MKNAAVTDAPRNLEEPAFREAPTDAELLSAFIGRRDMESFTLLTRRHGPMVFGVCRRVLRHQQDAEDAFQATFLVLARRAESIEPRERVANWLYGVAYRTALKASLLARKRRSREQQAMNFPEPAAAEAEPLSHDLRTLLDRELASLPDKYRLPIVLCDLEGQSYHEAARQLGWPEGTLSGRLARARRKLRDRLTRRGLVFSGASLAVLLSRQQVLARVPEPLLVGTVKATETVIAAGPVGGELVSSDVMDLAQGVIKSMSGIKSKLALALVLACGGATCGAVGWTCVSQETAPSSAAARAAPSESNDEDPDDVRTKEMARLRGAWIAVAVEKRGVSIADEELKAAKLTLSIWDEGFSVGRADRDDKLTGKIAIDPAKNPKEMDWVYLVANGKENTSRGIYEIDGDTLKFCYGKQRPTEFKTSTDRALDERLYVFKRERQQ